MKVLDLRCEHGHGFEGWFASGDAFEDQLARGLVECPVCGTTTVVKLLAAPRLRLLLGVLDVVAEAVDALFELVTGALDLGLEVARLRIGHAMGIPDHRGEYAAPHRRAAAVPPRPAR